MRRVGPPPKRFQVLGERSSGTNLVKRTLGRNSAMVPSEELGWKHACRADGDIAAELAVIAVVRAAEPWALSMFAKPWHAVPALQALRFPEFIRAPWDRIYDRARYFGGDTARPLIGTPLTADRDLETGAPYPTLFALRRAKLGRLLGMLDRDCTVALIRLEALQAAPEQLVARLLDALGQPPRTGPFRPVVKRLGSKFKPAVDARPDVPQEMSAADRAFMIGELDAAQEAALGYRYAAS